MLLLRVRCATSQNIRALEIFSPISSVEGVMDHPMKGALGIVDLIHVE